MRSGTENAKTDTSTRLIEPPAATQQRSGARIRQTHFELLGAGQPLQDAQTRGAIGGDVDARLDLPHHAHTRKGGIQQEDYDSCNQAQARSQAGHMQAIVGGNASDSRIRQCSRQIPSTKTNIKSENAQPK